MFQCSTCGEWHDEPALSFACDYPDMYANMSADEREMRAVISSDQCIIDEERFFIRGLIEIPIIETDDVFLWGVWASLTEKNFDEISALWETPGRERIVEDSFAALLANSIQGYYPKTADMKIRLRLQPLGSRPVFHVEDQTHMLGAEQAKGISRHAAAQKSSQLLSGCGRLSTPRFQ